MILFQRTAAFVLVGFLLIGVAACTEDFTSINTDPVEASQVEESLLFTRSLRKAMLDDFTWQVAEHLHANMFVQHFANSTAGFNTDRYDVNDGWLTRYWDIAYAGFGKDIQQVIDQTSEAEEDLNKRAQARIWKVFIVQRLTDFFGDVPYSEAFQGNATPAYDPQEDIYRDLFSELDAAVASFDPSQEVRFGAADVLFQGDLEAWTRFANSLRLRLAMRVSGVAPNLAQEQAQAAVEGGVIASNAGSAQLTPDGTSRTEANPLATVMGFRDSRVSQTLEEYLRSFNDPRLEVYISTALAEGSDERRGYPNGLSAAQIEETDVSQFSIAGPVFQDATNPISVLSHSEVKFLQAEAALKGYISGDPQALYEAGIRSAMARYGITGSAVETYLQQPEVAYDASAPAEEQLRQIITQKWLALFGRSGFEAWAEYRRTDYPELSPIQDPSGGTTNGAVPRRVPYPNEEEALNGENYQAAVSRLDEGDTYLSRMWWDVD